MKENPKRRVSILTKDRYLYQKLFLELLENGNYSFCDKDSAEIVICDSDTENPVEGAVTLSRSKEKGADITLPFEIDTLAHFLDKKKRVPLVLPKDERAVVLHGEKIKLTEIEYALFSLLMSRREFVTREEILNTVWHGKADDGIVNVYIHYLREKLEKSGEKLIISSRKLGYRISENYLDGEGEKL